MKKFWITVPESECEKYNSIDAAKEAAAERAVTEDDDSIIVLEAVESCEVEVKWSPVEPI